MNSEQKTNSLSQRLERLTCTSDVQQQKSDNEIDVGVLMGEGGLGCSRATGLMTMIPL